MREANEAGGSEPVDHAGRPGDALDERYGRRRQRGIDRRLAWGAGGALVLGGLIVVFFGGWHLTSDLEYKNLSYSVVDERTTQVYVQVTAPAESDLVCAVEALSSSRATVGWKLVEIAAGDERTRRFETDIVTTSPATTGTVRECWVLEA